MPYLKLTEIDSTNKYLMEHPSEEDVAVVYADYQTAGKGCGTNTWESERGKNLLFSVMIHPTMIIPRWQYLLSMTMAVALREVIEEEMAPLWLPQGGEKCAVPDTIPVTEEVTIKWPNDIYYGDRKLSGTLINLRLKGEEMQDMVIGVGLNVNQEIFVSDAPNPVSLKQITGHDHNIEEILQRIIERFTRYYNFLEQDNGDEIVQMYHDHLYRRTGMHEYEDNNGRFMAEIESVARDGIITLRRDNGERSRYEFKEVKFCGHELS